MMHSEETILTMNNNQSELKKQEKFTQAVISRGFGIAMQLKKTFNKYLNPQTESGLMLHCLLMSNRFACKAPYTDITCISNVGLYNGSSELADLDNIDEDDIARLISQKPAIRGIKVRMSHSVVQNTGTGGLLAAKKMSHKLQIPVFVHVGNQPPRLADILNLLDQGDVVTHIFHGKPGGCLDSREDILPELQNAINRGIYLDLGHGTESCSFSRFKQAREKGLCIDTISADLYSQNYSGPVYSLAHTMEKCMLMGMSLPEVLAAVTLKPSLVLRVPDIGKIKVGAEGDLTYFTIDDTEQVYSDSEGNKLMGKKQFHIHGVVRQGEIIVNDK